MKLKNIPIILSMLLMGVASIACSDSDSAGASRLLVSKDNVAVDQLTFSIGQGSAMLAVTTDGDWTAESADTTWCRLAVHAGYGYADSLHSSYTRVEVTKNTGEARTTTITVRAGDLERLVTVSQKGMGVEPGDPFESAYSFVENLRVGYNLGNTLDANPYDPTLTWWNPAGKTPLQWETAWGQPETTQDIIDAIAQKGFNAIRVPVTWYPHMDADDNVDAAWMDRVQQVVDMVLHAGCYCILNVQHDSGSGLVEVMGRQTTRRDGGAWLVADMERYPEVSARFQKLWTQIATRFRDYGDKLLFEAFNEILDAGFDWGDPADATAYQAINLLEQDFVTAVRATGGNNAYRNLVLNPYSAGSTQAKLDGMQIPLDEHTNHLACSVHSYDPYWFCNDGTEQYYIMMFDEQCTAEIDAIFARVNKRFNEELGVPYFFGEFGAIGSHPAMGERIKYAEYMTQKFSQYGVSGLWWMGLINRSTLTWTEGEIADALIAGTE